MLQQSNRAIADITFAQAQVVELTSAQTVSLPDIGVEIILGDVLGRKNILSQSFDCSILGVCHLKGMRAVAENPADQRDRAGKPEDLQRSQSVRQL
ncbi:MAG: hypothetical protein AAF636_24935 [Pseudomonadota bacterium]